MRLIILIMHSRNN